MEIHLKYIVLFVGMLSMFFAALPKYRFRYGLEVAWLIIFTFLAIRYDFGNDYMVYFDGFNWFGGVNNQFVVDHESHSEPGWQLLCQLFKPFGFFALVAVLTALECYVFYRFVKTYVPEQYYWFAIFIYVFNPSLMMLGASMMRNTLAIALFIWSVKYIREHRLVPFLLLITIATQIHSSAVVLYPFYLLGYLEKVKFNFWVSIVIVTAYIVLDSISANMQLVGVVESLSEFAGEEDALEYYTETSGNTNISTRQGAGFGVIIIYFIFGYLVMTLGQYSKNIRLIFLLLIVGTFVRPFAFTLPALSRFTYYFAIFQIACYPIILAHAIENRHVNNRGLTLDRIMRVLVLMCIVITIVREYIGFFDSPVWQDKFSEYHTIFEIMQQQ